MNTLKEKQIQIRKFLYENPNTDFTHIQIADKFDYFPELDKHTRRAKISNIKRNVIGNRSNPSKGLDTKESKSYKENLDKGTLETEILVAKNPRSPEEIAALHNIDTKKWKLSSYWSKERGKRWYVSALFTRKKETLNEESISEILKEVNLEYIPSQIHLNGDFEDESLAVLSLQDIHIGKMVLDENDTIVKDVKRCVETLIQKAYKSNRLKKIVWVIGGDLINMDTYLGTTTKLTPIENSMPATEAFKIAFELQFWAINFIKQYCQELEIVLVNGNHDHLISSNLAYSLSQCIHDTAIIWNISKEERKVVVYGNSMLCFEHGDQDLKKSFFVFATEFAKDWGNSIYRNLYVGHTHKNKKIEYITADEINGFTMRTLPSLNKIDKYHYLGKWTGNKRGGIIEIHSLESGKLGEYSHYYCD